MMSRITIVRRCYPLAAAALPRLPAPDGRTDPPRPPEETLAAEDATRTRAAVSAWLAAILTLAGAVITGIAFGRLPGLRRPGRDDQRRAGRARRGNAVPAGRAVLQLQYIGDHQLAYAVGPILSALGALFIYVVLAFLFRATRARGGPAPAGRRSSRSPSARSPTRSARRSSASCASSRARTSPPTRRTPTRSTRSGPARSSPARSSSSLGSLSLGFALVLVALHAMRVGLLTRFMGILGHDRRRDVRPAARPAGHHPLVLVRRGRLPHRCAAGPRRSPPGPPAAPSRGRAPARRATPVPRAAASRPPRPRPPPRRSRPRRTGPRRASGARSARSSRAPAGDGPAASPGCPPRRAAHSVTAP